MKIEFSKFYVALNALLGVRSSPVDRLGALRAEIANLEKEKERLEGLLKQRGPGEYEGKLFRATVSNFSRESVSWKDIAENLKPSPQLLSAHTELKLITKINVVARQ